MPLILFRTGLRRNDQSADFFPDLNIILKCIIIEEHIFELCVLSGASYLKKEVLRMKNKCELGAAACSVLERDHSLVKEDIGKDEYLSAGGIELETECYTVKDFGRLCMLSMQAPGGAMKMETVILVPLYKDTPLFNLDRVITPGGETQIMELYDVQIDPYPVESLAEFQELNDADADIADMPKTENWYDTILYPCSYHKGGEKVIDRFQKAVEKYLDTYARQLKSARICDPAEKGQKVRCFAETLYENSGPAVEQIKKLFGEEAAKRLVLDYMYGI